MARKKKDPNALEVIRKYVESGQYLLTQHSEARMKERRVILPEVIEVLRTGWHEKRKDTFDQAHKDWNYAIRSQTTDMRDLRVVVTIDELSGVIIITVIDLEQ